ncbi:MAG: carboxypeptidase-like regulatory domain-containing protein, partial [Hymenobacter sp.]
MLGKLRQYGWLITGVLWLAGPRLGWAQARHLLSGVVRGADGTVLPGASVAVPALSLGTATEADGHYRLSIPEGEQQITVSFVGYASQTFSLNLRRDQQRNVTLAASTSELGEVVVQGQQTLKEKLQSTQMGVEHLSIRE